jgi:hypothetical protein
MILNRYISDYWMNRGFTVEHDASRRAFKYFNENIEDYSKWKHGGNEIIGYNKYLPYSHPANQQALRTGRLSVAWYDYIMFPDPCATLINVIYLRNQY